MKDEDILKYSKHLLEQAQNMPLSTLEKIVVFESVIGIMRARLSGELMATNISNILRKP